MSKKILIPILIAAILAPILVGCTPGYVKDTVESQSPGAQIISAQKASKPEAVADPGELAFEAWCVVSQKDAVKTRWLIRQYTEVGTVVSGTGSEQDFVKVGCSNWNK